MVTAGGPAGRERGPEKRTWCMQQRFRVSLSKAGSWRSVPDHLRRIKFAMGGLIGEGSDIVAVLRIKNRPKESEPV